MIQLPVLLATLTKILVKLYLRVPYLQLVCECDLRHKRLEILFTRYMSTRFSLQINEGTIHARNLGICCFALMIVRNFSVGTILTLIKQTKRELILHTKGSLFYQIYGLCFNFINLMMLEIHIVLNSIKPKGYRKKPLTVQVQFR